MAKTPTQRSQTTIRTRNRAETRAVASKLRDQGRSYVVVRNGRKAESHVPKGRTSGYPAVFSPSRAVSPGRSPAGSTTPGTTATRRTGSVFGNYIPIPTNGPRRAGGEPHLTAGGNLFTRYEDLWGNPVIERNNMSVELFELFGTVEAMNMNPQYWRDQGRTFASNFPVITTAAAAAAGAGAIAVGSRYAEMGRALSDAYSRSRRTPAGFNLRAGNTGRIAGGAGLRAVQTHAGTRYRDPFVFLYR